MATPDPNPTIPDDVTTVEQMAEWIETTLTGVPGFKLDLDADAVDGSGTVREAFARLLKARKKEGKS